MKGIGTYKAEGVSGRKIPNGLHTLFNTVCRSWHPDEKYLSGSKRTTIQFAEEIFDIYKNNYFKYGFEKKDKTNLKDLSQRISRINRRITEPTFVDIKSYAEYIGVPPGIFLLISQMIGVEVDEGKAARDKIISIMEKFTDNNLHIYNFINGDLDGKIITTTHKKENGEIDIELDVQKLMLVINTVFGIPDHFTKETPQDFSKFVPTGAEKILKAEEE